MPRERCFVSRVGHANQRNYALHHPQFDIDEEAIMTGVITLAYSAWQYLERWQAD